MDVIKLREDAKDKVAQGQGKGTWNEVLAEMLQELKRDNSTVEADGFAVKCFNLLINEAMGEFAAAYLRDHLDWQATAVWKVINQR